MLVVLPVVGVWETGQCRSRDKKGRSAWKCSCAGCSRWRGCETNGALALLIWVDRLSAGLKVQAQVKLSSRWL